MKSNRLIALSLFAAVGVGLTTGCPGMDIPNLTPSASPSASAVVAPADIVGLNGRVLFDGAAPASAITLSLKKLNSAETSYAEVPSVSATTVAGGYYQVPTTDAGTYKVIYRQGTGVTFATDNNTVGYFQSKDLAFTAGAKLQAGDLDLFWEPTPSPFNTTVSTGTVNFTFKIRTGAYKYKISLLNGTTPVTTPDWTTPSGATATVPVTISSAGNYTYQILFRGTTGETKADGYTGESGGTPNIPFTVN